MAILTAGVQESAAAMDVSLAANFTYEAVSVIIRQITAPATVVLNAPIPLVPVLVANPTVAILAVP